ncbi:MAG: hypothetical protein KDJ89_06555, partial [Notoacmeibacter sp.]|nr:hypothetical protein [Notoacmeibacter sp.]
HRRNGKHMPLVLQRFSFLLDGLEGERAHKCALFSPSYPAIRSFSVHVLCIEIQSRPICAMVAVAKLKGQQRSGDID